MKTRFVHAIHPMLTCLLLLLITAMPAYAHAAGGNASSTSQTQPVIIEIIRPDAAPTSAPDTEVPPALQEIPTPAPVYEEPVLSVSDEYLVCENPSSSSGENQILLSFVGDCSIGDSLSSRKHSSSLTSVLGNHDDKWLFETVSDYFHADDFTFANLEVVLTENASPLYPAKAFNIIGRPEFAEILKTGGVDGVNTVNNHCIDFKYGGYEDTLESLERAGVMHFGSLNPTRSKNRYVTLGRLEIKGVRIGLIGFTYPTNANLELIAQDIQTLRSEGCQIVIVSLHWGREEKFTPNASQFPFAKTILDAGADMIWGHHPHVLQPVYFYNGKPIFFSTGNFVFGSIKNLDPASGIFQLTWDIHADGSVSLSQFHMVPTNIRHKKLEYRPLVLTDPQDRKTCLRHVMGKNDRYECLRLPDGFENTGTVYIRRDGSLALEP